MLFFEGLARSSSTDAAFVQKTLVVWVAILAVAILGERLSWPHVLAIGTIVVGQALVAGDLRSLHPEAGELMILAATLLWSVEIVVAKRLLVVALTAHRRMVPHRWRRGAPRGLERAAG